MLSFTTVKSSNRLVEHQLNIIVHFMLCFTNYCNDDYVDSAIHTDESTDDDARPDTDEVVESRLVAGRC